MYTFFFKAKCFHLNISMEFTKMQHSFYFTKKKDTKLAAEPKSKLSENKQHRLRSHEPEQGVLLGAIPKSTSGAGNWAVKRLKHREPDPIKVSPGCRSQESSMTCSISSVPGLRPPLPRWLQKPQRAIKGTATCFSSYLQLKVTVATTLCKSIPPCTLPAH